MAKTKNQPAKPAANTAARPTAKLPKTQQATPRKAPINNKPPKSGFTLFEGNNDKYIIPLVIGIITFFCYSACIGNKFTNWDDLGYITTDPLIKNSTLAGIKRIWGFDGFQVSCVMGNYHPLTIMTYAIEYSYVGLKPWLYHLDSVLLHVVLTIVIYYFVRMFTHRTAAAAVAALLFGVHPMHVESIAWGAGRKDILYSLFFILSFMTYLQYVRTTAAKKWAWFVLTLVSMALSLLCKSVSVTLPAVLLLIDYYEGRIRIENWKISLHNQLKPTTATTGESKIAKAGVLLEKIPFFLLAYIFGKISVAAQTDVGAYGSLDAHFKWFERASLGFYAFWGYLWKMFIPAGMCNFYPYPLKISDALPGNFYLYPAIVLALMAAVWVFGKKNRMVIFGCGFFLVNIVLLLQFIPVGGAIMSDRYGYMPYLGFFMIAGWLVSDLFEDEKKLQTGKMVLGTIVAYCLVLGYVSDQRCKVWYDAISLWKDDIDKHPDGPVGYFYLGNEYFNRYEDANNPTDKQRFGDSSLYFFNMSVARKPDYILPIVCIAELQRDYGLNDAAMETYFKAKTIDSNNESVYLGLGVISTIKKRYDSGEYYFKKALSKKSYYPEGYSNFANFLDIMRKPDTAIIVYNFAISQNPDAPIPYMNRAHIYLDEKADYDKAIPDYEKAALLEPNNGEPNYKLAICYFKKGNKADALKNLEIAKSKGYTRIPPDFERALH